MKNVTIKKGDIVLDMQGSSWGDTKFMVEEFHGCKSLRLAWAQQLYKPNTNKYHCNLIVGMVRLVDSIERPMRNLNKTVIIKLMNKGIMEARREFAMRLNSKTL